MISTRFMVPYTNINSVLNSNLGSKFPWVAVHSVNAYISILASPIGIAFKGKVWPLADYTIL